MTLGQKLKKPGLIINKTPIKPINIANHVFKFTRSLKIIADKATTKTGVKEAYYERLLDSNNETTKQKNQTLLLIKYFELIVI